MQGAGLGNRKTVDDTPYGGGDGMLIKPEPMFAAIEAAKQVDPDALVYLMTPRGERLRQPQVRQIATEGKGMIIFCARYEGYDERVTTLVDRQISIGDFVLTGGELPAMMLVDAVVRLLPGVRAEKSQPRSKALAKGIHWNSHSTRDPKNFVA